MKWHLSMIMLRILLAIGLIPIMPYTHSNWGEPYPGDGQQAFGMRITFSLFASLFALVYLLVGSLAQLLLWRRSA